MIGHVTYLPLGLYNSSSSLKMGIMRFVKEGPLMAQSWMVTAVWLFLAFFCYEMMRQQSNQVFRIAQLVQGSIERPQNTFGIFFFSLGL